MPIRENAVMELAVVPIDTSTDNVTVSSGLLHSPRTRARERKYVRATRSSRSALPKTCCADSFLVTNEATEAVAHG